MKDIWVKHKGATIKVRLSHPMITTFTKNNYSDLPGEYYQGCKTYFALTTTFSLKLFVTMRTITSCQK